MTNEPLAALWGHYFLTFIGTCPVLIATGLIRWTYCIYELVFASKSAQSLIFPFKNKSIKMRSTGQHTTHAHETMYHTYKPNAHNLLRYSHWERSELGACQCGNSCCLSRPSLPHHSGPGAVATAPQAHTLMAMANVISLQLCCVVHVLVPQEDKHDPVFSRFCFF